MKLAAQNIGLAALYCLAAMLGLKMAAVSGHISPVWPATGIAIAAVYLWGYRLTPGVWLGGLAFEIYAHAHWIVCLGAPIANILEPLIAVSLLRRFVGGTAPLSTSRSVVQYFAFAGALATAVSATVGACSMCAGGLGQWNCYGYLWSTWWLGDVMGAVVVAPAILVLAQPLTGRWPLRRRVEGAALVGMLVAVSSCIFYLDTTLLGWGQNAAISIFCMPLVIWAALRFAQAGSVTATLIICTTAIVATLDRRGPFIDREAVSESVVSSLLLLQAFMGVVAMTGLALAAVVNERTRAETALRESYDLLERKVEQRTEELKAAKEAAEDANRAKSGFLANMSHEIRTPMNGIIGMAELLSHTPLNPDQRDFLRMARQSADSLLRLLNDILDFSKIEAGKLELEEMDLSLRNCVSQAAQTLSIRAAEKNLELACRIAPDAPDALVGDPGRLRQILINLAGNAIKFTARGEVLINVDQQSRTNEEVVLHFSVKDTGVGIPRDKRAKIFESFTQADCSTTRQFGGTGLGLTISEQLVQMMKGRIWVESEVGVGSTFHFTAAIRTRKEPNASRPAELSALRGMPVLVVDDNQTNRRILWELLGSWGMKPSMAESAAAGLAAMRQAIAAGEPYRFLLLDLMTPEMDGFELAQRVRINENFRDCSLIMISSAVRPGDAERCRRLGIARYLTKPVVQTDLLESILAIVSARVEDKESAGTPSEAPADDHGGRNILLAEDGLINQKVAIGLLKKKGHKVVLAVNGREAVAALERQPFDLVPMDVQMPEMDGLEAARVIRMNERDSGRHTPIVAMTASAMKGDRESCFEAGMDGYVSKPIDPDQLYKAVEEFAAKVRL